MNTELVIKTRIALLRSRQKNNVNIIRKLERQLRNLQNNSEE